MARQRTAFRNSRLITGISLVGFGIFMLYENFAIAAGWLSHIFGANSEALGVVPAVILEVSQSVQAHEGNHQQVFVGFLQQIFVSSWPLLLVFAGTVLSHDTFTENATAIPPRNRGLVELAGTQAKLRVKIGYQSSSSPLEVRQNRFAE